MLDLLRTPARRKLLFAALYAGEGAPIGFLWWAMPTRLAVLKVPEARITALLAVLALPWAFKFLWAPLVDICRSPRWTFRSWIITAQLIMGLLLLPLMWLDWSADFVLIFTLLCAHAFAAATQDVAIDAMCISVTTEDERGGINGWMQVGMLSARALFGGGVLWGWNYLGTPAVITLLVAGIWSPAIVLLSCADNAGATTAQRPTALSATHPIRRFFDMLREVFGRRSTWLGLAFALIAGAGYEAVGVLAGPFLIRSGYSESQVGVFLGTAAIGCMIAGSLSGGYLADRIDRRKAMAAFTCLIAIAVWGVAAAAWRPVAFSGMPLGALGVLYVAIGCFTATSYALFMDLSDPRLGATQFSTFTGATNLCESWSGFAVGRLIGPLGYAGAFLVMGTVSLLATPLIGQLKTENRHAAALSVLPEE